MCHAAVLAVRATARRRWHHQTVRAKVLVLVAVAAVAAAAVVVASARTTANGLPAYTDGWQTWAKINRKPFTSTGPLSSAHSGRKNVYTSKRKVRGKYPNGTVIVKTIVKPGTRFVGQFAVMRKVKGRWRYVEYERSSARARYTLLAQGQLCSSCHARARANDYVFTKR
jgi:Cytochrome P460